MRGCALAEQVTYDLSRVVLQTEMQRQVVIDPLVRECTDEDQKWKKRDQQTGTYEDRLISEVKRNEPRNHPVYEGGLVPNRPRANHGRVLRVESVDIGKT
jgi:hypothetical protein